MKVVPRYTKKERKKFYIKALTALKKSLRRNKRKLLSKPYTYLDGICSYLANQLLKRKPSSVFQVGDFPEFLAYRPLAKRVGEYWWPLTKRGYEKRVKVLTKIISKM